MRWNEDDMKLNKFLVLSFLIISSNVWAEKLSEEEIQLASGHPRVSYEGVKDIDAMAKALQKYLAQHDRYSFSRSWWKWDRLRTQYVDHGRVNKNEIKILQAAFRALILDWYKKLEAKGEADLFFIFFVTTAPGNKVARQLGDRTLVRDVHGGGYHGGWGGASRMRIYEELVREGLLTLEEQSLFKKIVYQSLSKTFIDFKKGSQKADNHSFGNGGGIALALKIFPNAPQAKEAKAWLDRVWNHMANYGDWKEWNYYPYGPIFLHGLIDIAEATGRIKTDKEIIYSVAHRALAFIHPGGVRGNPNSGAPRREDLNPVYKDPWNWGYYNVETSSRDGNFWYRLAQHYKDPEFLWASEQVNLGGRPLKGKVSTEYKKAYDQRYQWFIKREIHPRQPKQPSKIGYLSSTRHRIPERLYLNSIDEHRSAYVSYFLYEHKDAHLDNVSGHLYEYSVNGSKFLHCSGKYNNVYNRDNTIRGRGHGEESLDLFLVNHQRHPFPLHPDRQGDKRDLMRRGSLKHEKKYLKVETNSTGDSFGQFAFKDYYGKDSLWIRRTILTREGHLIVLDAYRGGATLKDEYNGGPVWHVADPVTNANLKPKTGVIKWDQNWISAPAFDHAWWKRERTQLLLYFHPDKELSFGSVKQATTQDCQPNLTTYAYKKLEAGKKHYFLSVLSPLNPAQDRKEVVNKISSTLTPNGSNAEVRLAGLTIKLVQKGDRIDWSVIRTR